MKNKTNTMNCKNCGTEMMKGTKICPNCGKKNKKPIYQRVWFILLMIIFMFISFVSCSSGPQRFDWDEIILSDYLPEPYNNKGEIYSNGETYLSVEIVKISNKEYIKYVTECIEMGYDVEIEKTEGHFQAYNEEGYKLNLSYYDSNEELNIHLSAPEQLSSFTWPTSNIVKQLPKPTSNIGKINSESSDYFSILVGNMSLNEYNDYVDKCIDSGFDVDYSKYDTSFNASNKSGYKVYLSYEGNKNVLIRIEKTEEKEVEIEDNISTDSNDLSDDFITQMNNYEEFFNEYVEFMKKYKESDGSDISMIAEYADLMETYAKTMASFEELENSEMTKAETLYYIEVQSRITKKLLEVAN